MLVTAKNTCDEAEESSAYDNILWRRRRDLRHSCRCIRKTPGGLCWNNGRLDRIGGSCRCLKVGNTPISKYVPGCTTKITQKITKIGQKGLTNALLDAISGLRSTNRVGGAIVVGLALVGNYN